MLLLKTWEVFLFLTGMDGFPFALIDSDFFAFQCPFISPFSGQFVLVFSVL